jgi:hypothetical protein
MPPSRKTGLTIEPAIDCAVSQTKLFASPQVVVAHLRRLISVHRLCELQASRFHKSTPRTNY